MNNRVGIATLAVFLAGAPILALAVLTRPAPGTETTTAEQPSAVATEAVTQTATRTAPAVGDGVPLAPVSTAAAAAAVTSTARSPARRTVFVLGGTVTLTLERTDSNGSPVDPGTPIAWRITASVSASGNDGLALISVDLVQNTLVDLLPGTPSAEMVNFDRPNGICNLDSEGTGSAFGGTQVAGASGGQDLMQIGGSQNTFGVAGEAMGLVVILTTDVGFAPVVLAEGTFNAPIQTGDHTISLQNGIANVLDDLAGAPPSGEHWPVHEATVNDLSSESFTFTVGGT
ncbi:MAG: hypothetical protein IID34_10380 [Planctomycetes bacterium]|nr:hypothetical protein [Planctomycetota bacterium]